MSEKCTIWIKEEQRDRLDAISEERYGTTAVPRMAVLDDILDVYDDPARVVLGE